MSKGTLNKVQLIGRLGQDPEIRYTSTSSCIATLSLATGESWRDKQTGEIKEHTEWHRVVIFGKLAEIAGDYLHKGSLIYIEGQLRTRKWFDEGSGQDRYTTEVVVSVNGSMKMLGGANQSHQKTPASQSGWSSEGQPRRGSREESGKSMELPDLPPDYVDDIPF